MKEYIQSKLKEKGLYLHEEHSTPDIFVISKDTDRQHAGSLSVKDLKGLSEDKAKEAIDVRFKNLIAALNHAKGPLK
jgi:hypothetical protein